MQEYTVETDQNGKVEKCTHTALEQVELHIRSLKGTGTLVRVFERINGRSYQWSPMKVIAIVRG